MAAQFRPKLGMGLQNIVAGGYQTPPYAPDPTAGVGPLPNMAPGTGNMQAKKPGFFGQGGMGRYLAGAIGDALLQNADMQPVFAPMQRDKRRAEQEQAQWGLRRQQGLQDFEEEQRIRARYDKPAPYRFKDNSGNLVELGSDGTPRTLYDDPTPKMNFIPDGLGGGQWVAVPGQAPAIPSAPQPLKPVGKLRPVGGPTAPQSGGFR